MIYYRGRKAPQWGQTPLAGAYSHSRAAIHPSGRRAWL